MTGHRISLLLHVFGAILWVERGRWVRQLLSTARIRAVTTTVGVS